MVGHYTDPEVAEKIATWTRACAGWDASNNMKVMRWGDNMRNVAVTEGDKTEAERVFGASINTWAVNELVAAYEAVKDDQVKAIIEDYKAKYDVAPELLDAKYDSLFIAAKEEAAMINMMNANGCTAGVDNFEDLGALPQLPGRGPAALPVRVRLRLLRRRRGRPPWGCSPWCGRRSRTAAAATGTGGCGSSCVARGSSCPRRASCG